MPGDSIRSVLARDLDSSDWIRILSPDSIQGADAILQVAPGRGSFPAASPVLRVTLIDGATRRVYRWADMPAGDRWALHGIADVVQEWVTGHRGVAQTRLAYVSRGALHVVDADGTNDRVVSRGGIPLSPAWRHDGRALVYTELRPSGSHIVELELQQRGLPAPVPLPAIPSGLNITPVYSPDDRWIVFAHGGDRHTMLMASPRDGSAPPRVIAPADDADNTSPAFSPDGGRIAFTSGHSARPQVYSIAVDGTDERLETPLPAQGRSYRASPDWSPDGRTIAFEQQNGTFQIWTVTLPEHTMRRLTSVGENEDPTWAPDGRHLAFTSTRGSDRDIWVMDSWSGRLRQVTRVGDARLAAWSPPIRRDSVMNRNDRSGASFASVRSVQQGTSH